MSSATGLRSALHALRLKDHLLQEATTTLLKVLYYSLHLTQDSCTYFCPECYENLQRELENNIPQLSSKPVNVEHDHRTSHTVQGIDMIPIPRPVPKRKDAPEIPEPSNPLPGMPVPAFPDVAIPIVPELPVPEVPEFPMPMEPDKAPKKEPLPGEKVTYFLNCQDQKFSSPNTQDTLIDFRLLFSANYSLEQNKGAKSNFKSCMEDFTSISNYDLISPKYEIPDVLMMPIMIP